MKTRVSPRLVATARVDVIAGWMLRKLILDAVSQSQSRLEFGSAVIVASALGSDVLVVSGQVIREIVGHSQLKKNCSTSARLAFTQLGGGGLNLVVLS